MLAFPYYSSMEMSITGSAQQFLDCVRVFYQCNVEIETVLYLSLRVSEIVYQLLRNRNLCVYQHFHQ